MSKRKSFRVAGVLTAILLTVWYVMKLQRHPDESDAWAATAATELEGGVTWEKLMRYETSLERSLYRNLHELQRRQANRLGRPGSLPMVLDVDLAGGDG